MQVSLGQWREGRGRGKDWERVGGHNIRTALSLRAGGTRVACSRSVAEGFVLMTDCSVARQKQSMVRRLL